MVVSIILPTEDDSYPLGCLSLWELIPFLPSSRFDVRPPSQIRAKALFLVKSQGLVVVPGEGFLSP